MKKTIKELGLINVRIRRDLHEKLRCLAFESRITIQDALECILDDMLKDKKRKKS